MFAEYNSIGIIKPVQEINLIKKKKINSNMEFFVPLLPKNNTFETFSLGKIIKIEGMQDYNNAIFNDENNNIKKNTNITLNDDISTRLFIGGISAIGLIALYKLMYFQK
jgi:hypothetical protein